MQYDFFIVLTLNFIWNKLKLMLELQNDCSNVFQLLIGYENGTVVFWDLKSKRAELRVYYDEVSDFC